MTAINGGWYKAENTPQDATGLVGGSIDTGSLLVGTLSELFEPGHSKFLGRGDYDRFRKIFFRNAGNLVEDAVVFWADLEHIDQLYFAFEQTPGDTSTNSETMPAGYTTGDFVNPVGLVDAEDVPGGTITADDGELGLWVWQSIPEGLSPDTGALGVLTVAGNVS